eukprot:g29355.t1
MADSSSSPRSPSKDPLPEHTKQKRLRWTFLLCVLFRPTTPSSLQVHVVDSHGLLVAVELFHICVPGPDGKRGHFIGISEAENAMSSQASQSDSGSGQSSSSDAVSVVSSSSESSVTSANGLVGKLRACPEIEWGEIVVDAFCDRLSILEAHFRFNKAQSVEDSPAPSLLEWVWPSTRQKLHAAMSHGVNLLFAPPSANVTLLERRFDPIMFQLPFRMKNSSALVDRTLRGRGVWV